MAVTTFPAFSAAGEAEQASGLAQFFRGVVLIAYIGILASAALFALQNGFSRTFLDPPASTAEIDKRVLGSTWCEPAGAIYARWVTLTRHQPASGQMIDAIWPGWRASSRGEPCEALAYQAWWVSEFKAIDDVLAALVTDPDFDPKNSTLTSELLSADFADRAAASFTGKLPLPVQSWVLHQRMQRTLLDLFLLLAVIGTFGSLIYLLVQFIAGRPTTIAEFAFRPTLGAFLAIAIFVADVGLVGVTSSAGLFEVRAPTLYLFALGAGLSSDVIYAYLLARVASAAGDASSAPRGEAAAR